jgi:hypothetical protein
MALVYPKDFYSTILSPAKTACPEWDFPESDPTGIDKFYKKQGWNSPLPLPPVPAATQ